jgi:hypothetical protein
VSSQVFYDMHQTPVESAQPKEGPLERARRWEREYREWRAEVDRLSLQRAGEELAKFVRQSPDARAAIRESFSSAQADYSRSCRYNRRGWYPK